MPFYLDAITANAVPNGIAPDPFDAPTFICPT
jgi:hypothetical protein